MVFLFLMCDCFQVGMWSGGGFFYLHISVRLRPALVSARFNGQLFELLFRLMVMLCPVGPGLLIVIEYPKKQAGRVVLR